MKYDFDKILSLFKLPFNELLFRAQDIHRKNFPTDEIQISTLLNIKTGGCTENCGYCSQSKHSESKIKASKLMSADEVTVEAQKALESGAKRFCMGAAWRSPKQRDIPKLVNIIEDVKKLGLETCMTLGMLDKGQASELKAAGLDYYNHNIDTSKEYYENVITTRKFEDRIDTLDNVRKAGIKVCSGGILGMGESVKDRASMLKTLADMPEPPESVPINMLVPVKGTKFADIPPPDNFDFIRTIAVARILMPKSYVRLSAGRESMSDEMQALCFLAGANSVFYGEKLLTTGNASTERDTNLFKRLGMNFK